MRHERLDVCVCGERKRKMLNYEVGTNKNCESVQININQLELQLRVALCGGVSGTSSEILEKGL